MAIKKMRGMSAVRFSTRTKEELILGGHESPICIIVCTNEGSVLVSLCAEGKRSSPRSPARSEQSLLRFSPR